MSKNTKTITFPPANADEEAKIRRFLKTVGEFMGVDLEPQLVTIVGVEVPMDRPDVITVLNKAAAGQKKKEG
jgi:hypothetical protein